MKTKTQNIEPKNAVAFTPKGWLVKEFGNIAEVSKGKYVPSKAENLKCIELEHIDQAIGRINGWINSSEQKSTKNKFTKGQILFGKLRPYLKKYWLANFDGVCSSEIWVLNSKDRKISNTYLFHLIQTNKFIQVANVSSGSKMPRADWNFVAEYPFSIPPPPEQNAIATCLSTWDNAISKTQALIAQKEQRKKWLMQQLLTGKKRLKGFEGEWKDVELSEIFNRVTRKNTEGNKNVITISAQRGFVKQTDFFNKSIASELLDNYFLVNHGEFCYNKSYSNGYPWGAIKRLNAFDKAVVTTLYICFNLRNVKTDCGDFFEQFFQANLLDKGLIQIAHEGGRAHGLLNVTPSDFFSIKIFIPTYKEQKAIANVLQAADKEIQTLKQQLDKLKEQKKGLMQVLLTGKKRLNGK